MVFLFTWPVCFSCVAALTRNRCTTRAPRAAQFLAACTRRTGLTFGARYMYTATGKPITDLDALDDGMAVVVSSKRGFIKPPVVANLSRPGQIPSRRGGGGEQVPSAPTAVTMPLRASPSPQKRRSVTPRRPITPRNASLSVSVSSQGSGFNGFSGFGGGQSSNN